MVRTQRVFVVVRHTRAGDDRHAVLDDDGSPTAREHAMGVAREVCDDAAAAYGYGASSVFRGTLAMQGRPLKERVRVRHT